MAVKIAINGLGRIGRCVARIIADRDDVELVVVNASGTHEMLEYNIKYDSVHGTRKDVKVSDGYLNIGKDKAKILAERDPTKLNFSDYGAEVVLECTGAFLTQESVQPHMTQLLLSLVQMKKSMPVKLSFQMHLVQPTVWLL